MIRSRVRLVALAVLACVALAGAPARAAEVQVPFDAAGRIQRIDEPLARRIGLFVEKYPGFQEARLFAAGDSSFVLEVSMVRGGQLSREREVLTREQADALRADITGRLAAAGPEPAKPDQGAGTMLTSVSTVLGLGFYGWAVPYMLDVQDPSVALGAYMLTAGASFFVPLMLTRDKPVTWGAADLALYGASRGIVHGLLLAEIVEPEGGFDDDGRTTVALTFATSVTEYAMGYAVGKGQNLSAGSAGAIHTGGDFGMLWGFLASDLAGYTDRDDGSATAATVLGSSVAGMVGGGLLAGRRAYSYGDGMAMRGAGYVGVLVGTAFADAAHPGESDTYSAGILVGSLAGLVAGDRLVAGREFTVGEGVLLQLGGIAGGLTGLGVVALGSPDGDNASTAYWAGTALGGVAGYALTYGQLSRKAAARSASRTSWRIDLAPEGLLAAVGRGPGAGASAAGRCAPPLARLTCTF